MACILNSILQELVNKSVYANGRSFKKRVSTGINLCVE